MSTLPNQVPSGKIADEPSEAWKRVWRIGIAPLLSTRALLVLCEALKHDDKRLIQAATTQPPALQCVQDWPVEAADAIAFCGWIGEGRNTVADVEEFFANTCSEASERLGEPTAVRHFLNHYDEEPREVVFNELLAEVQLALRERIELEKQRRADLGGEG